MNTRFTKIGMTTMLGSVMILGAEPLAVAEKKPLATKAPARLPLPPVHSANKGQSLRNLASERCSICAAIAKRERKAAARAAIQNVTWKEIREAKQGASK